MLTSLACASAFMALPPACSHRTATGTSTGTRPPLRRPSVGAWGPVARSSEATATLQLKYSANGARLPIRQLIDADQICFQEAANMGRRLDNTTQSGVLAQDLIDTRQCRSAIVTGPVDINAALNVYSQKCYNASVRCPSTAE